MKLNLKGISQSLFWFQLCHGGKIIFNLARTLITLVCRSPKLLTFNLQLMPVEIIFHHFNAIISLLFLNPDLCFSVASENIFIFSKLFMFYFILPKISSEVFTYSSIQRKTVSQCYWVVTFSKHPLKFSQCISIKFSSSS